MCKQLPSSFIITFSGSNTWPLQRVSLCIWYVITALQVFWKRLCWFSSSNLHLRKVIPDCELYKHTTCTNTPRSFPRRFNVNSRGAFVGNKEFVHVPLSPCIHLLVTLNSREKECFALILFSVDHFPFFFFVRNVAFKKDYGRIR